ncbi:MAG: tetratricopeptide repeat protein, partial [Planctomycetota bacterium]
MESHDAIRTAHAAEGAAAGPRLTPSRFAALLFVGAYLVRALYVMMLREHPRFEAPTMDAGYHLAWARALADGTEFRDGPFFRAPLYPIVLAALLKVTGGSLVAVRMVQAALGACTAVLTYRLGRRVAGEGAGRTAGGLVAVAWTLISFDAELLIPVLLIPLLLAALDAGLGWLEAEGRVASGGADAAPVRWTRPAGVGILFGLAAITRPNVLLFMPVLFFLGWRVARRLGPPVWLTVGTLAAVVPVTLHNALEGDASLIATQGGVNFWIGNNPSSDGAAAIVPGTRDGWWEGYFDAIAQAEALEGRELQPTEVSAHYRDRAFSWFAESPGAALRHFAWKARLLFANVEIANNQDMRFLAFRTLPPLRFSPSRWGVLLGLGVVGLALLVRQRRPGAGTLAAFGGIYALSIVLFFVNARFRLPLVPILSVGAGAALQWTFAAFRRRDWRGFGGVFVPAALLAGLSFVLPRGIVVSDANGLAELGRAELARGNAEAALNYLDQAIRANPNSVQVRMALASAVVAAKKDPERALILLEEAKALPRGGDLRLELEVQILDTRLSAGDVEGALASASRALEDHPRDGALRFVHARATAMAGEPRAAIQLFEELLRDEPTNASVALRVAFL